MSQSAVLKGVVSLALLLSLCCSAMQQAILRDSAGFKILDKGRWNQVHNYDVDPMLRKMNVQQLRKFFATGCSVRASKLSNGDYVLRGHVPGKGGGPVLAGIVNWGVRSLCWGAVGGAAITATVVTGGAIVGAATGAGAIAGAGAVTGALTGPGPL